MKKRKDKKGSGQIMYKKLREIVRNRNLSIKRRKSMLRMKTLERNKKREHLKGKNKNEYCNLCDGENHTV